MTSNGIFQIVAFTLALVAIAKPLGSCMANLFAGERAVRHRVNRPLERRYYVTVAGAIAGPLIFFPAVSVRPVVGHFLMTQGRLF